MTMRQMTRSLVTPILGVYLGLVLIVVVAGLSVAVLGQRQLRDGIRSADLALAQSIALDLDDRLRLARNAVLALSSLEPVTRGDAEAARAAFKTFKAARPEVDRVYWLDNSGRMSLSEPFDVRTIGADYSEQPIFLRARATPNLFVEAGAVDLTTYNPVAIVVQPVYSPDGVFVGALASNLSLDDISAPIRTIVADQERQGATMRIEVLNAEGRLVASAQRERILQNMSEEIPIAAKALQGGLAHEQFEDWRGDSWLASAAPMPGSGWAVVVQRPATQALQPISTFSRWLTSAALLLGATGLLYWLALSRQVIRPLLRLSTQHQMLLRASSDVIGTLDPREVVSSIVRAARTLVDAQAAAVLVPDERQHLRVLASEGRSRQFDDEVYVAMDDDKSPSALALREGRPVQLLAGHDAQFSPHAYNEGFRTVLAIPIISRHAGAVVLVVHRSRAQAFSTTEIELLLTLANHATLAWEHAKLYERSDIRLRTEQQRLTALMRSMEEGLILADGDGNVVYANRAASTLTGSSIDSLQQSALHDVQSSLRRQCSNPDTFEQTLARLAEHGEMQIDLSAPTLSRTRALSIRSFNVRNDSEDIVGKGWLLRDITRDQEVDRFKSALLAAVGHEVRTPLAAIKGNASSILMDDVIWPAADLKHFAQTIDREADRLARTINHLLDLSRSEAGVLRLNREPLQLPVLARSALARAEATPLDFRVDIPADLPPLLADADRIEIVLANLISNAAAYGNGVASLKAYTRAGEIVIDISDNGPGIASEELPYVFDRFYRAAAGVKRRAGGSGLGLAICRAFVEAHHGRIWVSSDQSGTTFSLSLPVAAVAATQDARAEAGRP